MWIEGAVGRAYFEHADAHGVVEAEVVGEYRADGDGAHDHAAKGVHGVHLPNLQGNLSGGGAPGECAALDRCCVSGRCGATSRNPRR